MKQLPFEQELLDVLTQCTYEEFVAAMMEGLTVMGTPDGNKDEKEKFNRLGLLIDAWKEALDRKKLKKG